MLYKQSTKVSSGLKGSVSNKLHPVLWIIFLNVQC